MEVVLCVLDTITANKTVFGERRSEIHGFSHTDWVWYVLYVLCVQSWVAHSYSNEGLISYDDFFFRGKPERFTNAKITYTWPDRGERKADDQNQQ